MKFWISGWPFILHLSLINDLILFHWSFWIVQFNYQSTHTTQTYSLIRDV